MKNIILSTLILKNSYLSSSLFSNLNNLYIYKNNYFNFFNNLFFNINQLNNFQTKFNNFLNSILIINKNINIYNNRQVLDSTLINFNFCEFNNINGFTSGSALYCTNTNLNLKNCKFFNCTSTSKGGAIYLNIGQLNIYFCCFYLCNCFSTSDLSGRCFYSEKSQSIMENSIFLYSGNNTGGDSTFCYYQSISFVSNYNISNCFGIGGIACGEFYEPISGTSIKFGYILKNAEYCAYGTWTNPMSGIYMNFINLTLSHCLAHGHGSFYLFNSIIWNCLRTLFYSTSNNLFFQNCYSDFNYKTGIMLISSLTTHPFSTILCSYIFPNQCSNKIIFLNHKLIYIINFLN